jgi:phage terminase Nu1 subunit (DNA packaging protein)
MAEEKLRQITARRELEEMKVKRTRGELHHTEDIKRIFGTMLSRLRTGLESFPLGIAPKLTEKTDLMEIAGIIKNQLDKIMYEVTEYDIDKIKTDVGAEYIAGLEAENKTESHESDQGV